MHAVDWIDEMENTLADAVEVRNRESLHRYVVQVAHRFGEGNEDLRVIPAILGEIKEIKEDILAINVEIKDVKKDILATNAEIKDIKKEILAVNTEMLGIRNDIRVIHVRMEASDKRFEDLTRHIDTRFRETQHNLDRRFNAMQAMTALGFTVIATMMTLIRLFG